MGKPKRRRTEAAAKQEPVGGATPSEDARPGWKPSTFQLILLVSVLAIVNYAAMNLYRDYVFTNRTDVYQITGNIQTKNLSSPRSTFSRKCVERGVPIVLKNSVVELWRARKKWAPNYLESRLAHLSGVYENENRWFGPYYDKRKPLTSLLTRLNPYRTDLEMSARQFFRRIQNPQEGSYLYFTGDIDQLGEWTLDEITPLDELLAPNPKRSSINVWIGQPHVLAHCHYDGYHNFYAQLYGTKKFTLFKPTNWPGLYPYPFLHPSHAQAQVNVSNFEDARTFPLVEKVEAVEAVLEPGDLLYVPPLWFHHVESLGVSISVNVWTDSHQTETMEEVFSLELPMDVVEWPDIHTRSVGTSILIHSLLQSVCEQRQQCTSPHSDRFSDKPNLGIEDAGTYFVYKLWSTRYRTLMDAGELPTSFDGDILCESSDDGHHFVVQEAISALEAAGYRTFVDKVSQLVGKLPAETWEVWMGNYVEFVVAGAVHVKYVGVFLKNYASCLMMV